MSDDDQRSDAEETIDEYETKIEDVLTDVEGAVEDDRTELELAGRRRPSRGADHDRPKTHSQRPVATRPPGAEPIPPVRSIEV